MERYTTGSLPGPSSAEVVTKNPAPRPIAASNGGRSIGKAHKSPKEALKRSYISPSLKTPFEKRKEKEKAQEAVKAVEQEMKEDEEAKKLRCVVSILCLGMATDANSS
jgi:rRNA-processing protein CGR1